MTRAILWMLIAVVAFSLVAVAGREAAKGVNTFEMMFGRSLIGLLLLAAILLVRGGGLNAFRTAHPGLHLVRNIVHYGAQFSWLYALTLIPLATLFALEFTAPLWVAVLAPLILGERLTPPRLLAALGGFIGVLIVVRPGAGEFTLGMGFGLSAAIGFALGMIATKYLTRTEATFTILLWMHLLQTLAGVVPLAWSTQLPDLVTTLWVAVVALGGLSAHFALARAFALADAIVVAPMDLLRLPLIALIGILVYNEPLDPIILAGAATVIAANLFNLWAERRRTRG